MYFCLFKCSLRDVYLKFVYFKTSFWKFAVVYFRARYGTSTFPRQWRSGFWPLVSLASLWPLSNFRTSVLRSPRIRKRDYSEEIDDVRLQSQNCLSKLINMNLMESWFKILLLIFVGFRNKPIKEDASHHIYDLWVDSFNVCVGCVSFTSVLVLSCFVFSSSYSLQVVIIIYFTKVKTSSLTLIDCTI